MTCMRSMHGEQSYTWYLVIAVLCDRARCTLYLHVR